MKVLQRKYATNYRKITDPSGSSIASLRESPEKAIRVPLRPILRIGDLRAQIEQYPVEFRRRRRVHRLIQIVRRRMITVLQPVFRRSLLRRPRLITELERQRRHALTNETVLIAANEQIAVRLLIGLYGNSGLLADLPNIVPQRRFRQALHLQITQREQRQEHIHIDI